MSKEQEMQQFEAKLEFQDALDRFIKAMMVNGYDSDSIKEEVNTVIENADFPGGGGRE